MTSIRHIALLPALIAGLATVIPLAAQSPPPPIIHMHLHALQADAQGPPPMGMCTGTIGGFPAMDAGRPWPDTFMERFKKPPCARPIWSPTTARELMDRTFAVMKRRNVYRVTSGSLTEQWKQACARAHHCEPRVRAGRADHVVTRRRACRAQQRPRIAHLARSRISIRASTQATPPSIHISRSWRNWTSRCRSMWGRGRPDRRISLPEISRAPSQSTDD